MNKDVTKGGGSSIGSGGGRFSQYENRGLTGLLNVGNTCYLNSCMQVLSHTYELNNFLADGEYKKRMNNIPDSVVLLEWDKLRELMWSMNCTVSPNGFVNAIRQIATIKKRDIFSGYNQNDVQEFLLFIIDCFHNALTREVEMQISGVNKNDTDKLAIECFTMMKNSYKNEYSDLLNIFYGIHVYQVLSQDVAANPQLLSAKPEPFSVINLAVPTNIANPSLYDCFDLYCKAEEMNHTLGNAWFNETTNKKENVTRGLIFWSLPDVMILDLKRWAGHNTRHQNKLHTTIDIPLINADFSKYVKGYQSASYIYDLYAVGNHSGGAQGGHYTATIKNANGKWYVFDDSAIAEIPPERVISHHAYCLFYRKKK
jgi:ubiquitin C-terminal hydrolase